MKSSCATGHAALGEDAGRRRSGLLVEQETRGSAPRASLVLFFLLRLEVHPCGLEHSDGVLDVVRPDQVQQVTDQVRSHVLGAVVVGAAFLMEPVLVKHVDNPVHRLRTASGAMYGATCSQGPDRGSARRREGSSALEQGLSERGGIGTGSVLGLRDTKVFAMYTYHNQKGGDARWGRQREAKVVH